MFYCKKCAVGCDVCLNESPCLSSYNWAFRISLLTITILCIIFTLLLGCYIYRFRKLKVIKVASPIFLCITLLGCSIMYSEVFQSSFISLSVCLSFSHSLSLSILILEFVKPISVKRDQQMTSKSNLFIPLKLN
jgi:hypothetical protein